MEKSHTSFVELIQEIDNVEREQRDRGTLFELLTITYLSHEPIYNRMFDAVWTLNEVPVEYNIPKVDTGVDLVARKRDNGDLVAVQCKFYSKDTNIQKRHVDSFLNELGKSYYAEGLIVTTTDKWSHNAETALEGRDKKVYRLSLSDLAHSQIDWSSFSFEKPKSVELQAKKTPRPHQKPAIKAVVNGFEKTDRGKLIMAPGTGKTFTSMAIAEQLASKQEHKPFKVLYFVPSIQLLSQTVRSWNADIHGDMETIAVCSDRKVTKQNQGMEDIGSVDLGFSATTSSETLLSYQQTIEQKQSPDIIAVFSTYQSIDVLIDAQKQGFYEFDLIICDEAHRTTGATEQHQEESHFVKVHRNENIRAQKRLYQTATPRVYGEEAKQKADNKSIVIADMNDTSIFGEEFYRIGFGDAVHNDILSDYKVMVLAVDEEMIARRFQTMLAHDNGLEFDDVTKIIGCWNGLVKRNGQSNQTLGDPMKRAIAFTGTIDDSKMITDMFSNVVEEYLNELDEEKQFHIDIQHADGSMNAIEKNTKIDWLQSHVSDNTCRVLSNARFLTEGVDVPELDAVMFLQPRRSKIDIAQAVGRVMRKAENKDYGYIILPIGIPAGADETNVLDNNEKYRVVWDVLNALRSIDERFDATINKLELNNKKPKQLIASKVGDAPNDGLETPHETREYQTELDLYGDEDLSDLERAIYGKIVRKVGNVRYWEQWSEDVAEIARKHIMRINVMLEDENSEAYKEFGTFVTSLRNNINYSITDTQAIEMLAQHLITKPIFEALFHSNSFVLNNPVSKSMESILNVLDKQGFMKEQERLQDFYDSVRARAEGIDNLEAKQKIIVQLYEKFFKVGFKETTEQLGIVFTPVELVDFIIHSVEDVLEKHFNKSLSSKGVHVFDPFTGTGTFITRLLQSGFIPKEDLLRKYTQELHANEIVLLSYYIAAINIEETFHSLAESDYQPFEGIVLTDTFESMERRDSLVSELFDENNERLKKQQEESIFAIIGNPPYKARQTNDNDNIQKSSYAKLDESIKNTYVKHSNVVNKNTLYDPLVRAFRWATDRIGDQGIIGFVTNSAFINAPTTSGIRKSFYEDFNISI
ncbi:DEAD/DEAH box helicase family protein [Alkalibacillus haloalkaliphilus]|uniref:restriction endonuclease n=1 Tax=Alkalibacillus haloalkaliphilus TaxID=94136 RepID=UPI0002E9D22A